MNFLKIYEEKASIVKFLKISKHKIGKAGILKFLNSFFKMYEGETNPFFSLKVLRCFSQFTYYKNFPLKYLLEKCLSGKWESGICPLEKISWLSGQATIHIGQSFSKTTLLQRLKKGHPKFSLKVLAKKVEKQNKEKHDDDDDDDENNKETEI